jgi:anti-sigma regulatory factor (Ser/Thr protein kinase)
MTPFDEAWTTPTTQDRLQFAYLQAAADPTTAALLRRELGKWLRASVGAEEERVDDILLAVYEAFANAAEYAYRQHTALGTVDVHARLDSDADTLTVTITDQGHWRPPQSESGDPKYRLRGRGIPLMKALASDASIRATAMGTEVNLTWRGLRGAS